MLLYNGRFNHEHDYFALEIVGGQVQLNFSTGGDHTIVSPYVDGGVSDGEWHTVEVRYRNKVGREYMICVSNLTCASDFYKLPI